MIKTDIKLPVGYTAEDIKSAICCRLPVERCEVGDTVILKRSLNISDKANIHYDVTVGAEFSAEREAGLLKMKKKVSEMPDFTLSLPKATLASSPVVVGSGPAGLFAALALAEAGANPILYERGLPVEKRLKKVSEFEKFGILDTECNVQFGEGGAGTYSDGKLKVGGMDKYKMKVLREFVSHGAPEDIIYSMGAHVGTDKLAGIVKGIREKIIALGGEVHFCTKLVDLKVEDGKIVGVRFEKCGSVENFEAETVVLATGHSARDVFELLRRIGARLEGRGFGIGLRIEHPREYIDRLIYGKNAPDGLGTASYHLVTHLGSGRSVYSFCMCPGGEVVAAASEEGGIVTNGMSEYARMADNSNSALLVSVTPDDFCSDDPLAGIELQRKIDRQAFALTKSTYKAPVTSLGAFLANDEPSLGGVSPSYKRGTELFDPREYLPDFITESLAEAMGDFDAWMPGFSYPDAVLSGPETRTTSPVRVERHDSLEAVGISGLYPTGEGAGYAGGIVSSARDGLLVAERILLKGKATILDI